MGNCQVWLCSRRDFGESCVSCPEFLRLCAESQSKLSKAARWADVPRDWPPRNAEEFKFSSFWTVFSWYVQLGWNNPGHSAAMIIPCYSGEQLLRLQSKSALAMKPLRRQLLVAVHSSRVQWVRSDISRFLHGSGYCCFWNGRNLFYRQPPSTFWCFVSLHFLTSWTLGPRHLNRTLQPEYEYIYICGIYHIILRCVGVNCFLPLNFMITRTMARQFWGFDPY